LIYWSIILNANYGKQPSVIEKLETSNICLYDAINISENTIQSIENVRGEIENKIATKFRKSLSKSFNYQKIKFISSILVGVTPDHVLPLI